MYYEEDYKFSNIILAISSTIMFGFIALFCFVFIGIAKVDAVNNDAAFPFIYEDLDITTKSRSNLGILGTSRGYMMNCSSSTACNTEVTQYNAGNGYIFKYGTKLTNDTNGFRWDFLTNETLYNTKLYAINTYYCATNNFTPVHSAWSGGSQASYMAQATIYYNNYKTEPLIYFTGATEEYNYCFSSYQIVKPTNNGMYYGLQVKTNSGSVSSNYAFLGYNVSALGDVTNLTQTEIQNIVTSSVNSSTSSINANIDSMEQNITNEINEMTSEQEKTNEKLDETNDKLDETNDYLKDDTAPESDISGLGNIEGLLPPGPLDTLLNIPIQFLSKFITGLNETCTPLRINFFWDMPIEFPCFGTSLYSKLPTTLEYAINLIPGVLILIKYFKYLYKKVERATSFNTNVDDLWGAI